MNWTETEKSISQRYKQHAGSPPLNDRSYNDKLTAHVISERVFQTWQSKGLGTIGMCECTHKRGSLPYVECRCYNRHFLDRVIRKKNEHPNLKLVSKKKLKKWILAEYNYEGYKDGLMCIEKLVEAKCYTTPQKKLTK